MKPQKKKQPAKSKTKPAPVDGKGKKRVQNIPNKRPGDAASSKSERDETFFEDYRNYFGDPDQPENTGLLRIYYNIREEMELIYIKADNSSKDAFKLLLDLTNTAAALVGNIVSQRPAFAKAVAVGEILWPVSISASKNYPQDLDELRKQLELGKASEQPYDVGRLYDSKSGTPCRQILEHCLLIIQKFRNLHEWKELLAKQPSMLQRLEKSLEKSSDSEYENRTNKLKSWCINSEAIMRASIAVQESKLNTQAKALWKILKLVSQPTIDGDIVSIVLTKSLQLPTQSSESVDEWVAVIYDLLMAFCDDNPANSPTLMKIGKSAANLYYRQVADKTPTDAEIERMKKERNAKQSEITNAWNSAKQQLKRAFKAICKKSSGVEQEK